MNTSKLKKFAQEARQKLMEQVGARLDYILNTDTAELREKAGQVKALKDELTRSGRGALIEKVAYTWFNRLMALRYMDVNDYQPLDIRVLSPKEGYTTPELLDEAKRGHIPDELRVNAQRINDLLDGRLPSANPQNEAYKILLIAACNHLSTVLPFLFERLSDYTELLLPDDLTSEFSIVHDVCEGMAPDDCTQVEVIGWLYQFYISEKKDEVFEGLKKNIKVTPENIPAATQLFTPRWIVQYMVENTLGKLWLTFKPNSELRAHMRYYLEEPAGNAPIPLPAGINGITDITFLDPCMGSGHVLVYAFELLARIYEEEGYSINEVPSLILKNNLFGIDIDGRAAQLAAFALTMKARSYHRRFFRGTVSQPQVIALENVSEGTLLQVVKLPMALGGKIRTEPSDLDLHLFTQADNIGSLIQIAPEEVEAIQVEEGSIWQDQQEKVKLQATYLSRRYHCVVTNPPYMGGGGMNDSLKKLLEGYFPLAKSDLMTCFMERAMSFNVANGFWAMINLPSWMFLSSFEKFREKLLQENKMGTMLHLGRGIFGSDFGSVAFTMQFRKAGTDEKGVYRRLFKEHVQVRSVEAIEKLFFKKDLGYFLANQKDFEKIPGSPIGYWLSERWFELFTSESIGDAMKLKKGMSTGDNSRFIKKWQEVSLDKTIFNCGSKLEGVESRLKWYPISSGGDYRKWYGNNFYVANWLNDGEEMKANATVLNNGGHWSRYIVNTNSFFQYGLCWNGISSGNFGVRILEKGFLFSSASMCGFGDSITYAIALLNSKISAYILDVLAPTVNFGPDQIRKIPFIKQNEESITALTNEIIYTSKISWDRNEISWGMQQNGLLRIKSYDEIDLEETYDLYQHYWKNKFFQLHRNEEELNRQFIDIYGLQEELTPEVPLDEITILQDETSIQKGELVFKPEEVMAQFVSYAVGCMFGRYALDTPGLVLANQGETLQDYLLRVPTPTFTPDADNIIPILDDEWFEDDIVGRFYEFLKVSFGAANFNKNLAFLEECLGKDLRRYFIKDFYADHISRYKKRPIYWLFSSPQGSFNALVYLHRYTPDTLSQILNKYLREYQAKLRTQQEHLDRVEVSGTAAEKAKAVKDKAQLAKVLLELQEYEREILYPLATERIALDLDDGVLVNYNKLGRAVKLVPGLNDPKTKKKVREFDWIDGTQIR